MAITKLQPFNLDATANYTFANITASNANLGNAATASYFIGSGNNLSNIQGANVSGAVSFATTANAVAGANVSGQVANALLSGTVYTNAQPNITSVGTLTTLTVSGSGSFGGNVNMNSFNITNLATPNLSTDAATKQYVDDVAQGLNVHDAVAAATTDTLANITTGTVTYDNGTSGVGANLTTTGTFNLIDGVNVQTSGTRILVKNEANAVYNGIYTWSNATVITRATDYNSVPEVEAGDFVFVTGGTIYDNTGWVQTSTVSAIGTVGNNIEFTQFSGAGTYQAGTGLTLTGTTFSVNASQTQVTAVGTLTGLTSNGIVNFANTSNVTLGAVANVHITGGSSSQYLQTDGAGNLTWAAVPTGSGISNGTSNINIPAVNGNINLTSGGNTSLIVTDVGANITGNMQSTGNITAQYFVGNGYYLTGVDTNPANIANGTSNVEITLNGNVITSVGGNANILVVTGTGINVSGNATIGTGTGGNIIGANVVNANTVTASSNVTAQYFVGNGFYLTGVDTSPSDIINGNSNVQVTLNGNVTTSVSGNANVLTVTGTGINVSGNATIGTGNGGNITGANIISANTFTALTSANFVSASNVSLGAVGNIKITGGTNAYVLSTDGAGNLSWVAQGGGSGSSSVSNGNSNVNIPVANGNVNISAVGVANVLVVTGTGANISGTANITGNVNAPYFIGNGAFLTGVDTSPANISNGTSNVQVTLNGNVTTSVGTVANVFTVTTTGANISGTLNVTGQSNLGNVGNVKITGGTSGYVLGTDGAGNLNWVAPAAGSSIISNGNSNVRIATANGNVSIAAVGNSTMTITGTGANISGYANITGNVNAPFFIGNGSALTGIGGAGYIFNGTSSANIPTSGGNLNISIAGNSNIGIFTGTGLNVAGYTNVTGNVNAQYFIGNGFYLTGISTSPGNISNGTSNVQVLLNGNVTTSVNGNANVMTVTGTGANITGTANISGNLSAGNLNTSGQLVSTLAAGTAPLLVVSTTQVANLNVEKAGTVTTNAQPNITSVGSLTGLTVSNATGVVDFTTTANVTLGAVGNLHITGGTSGYVLQTDGLGNLSWDSTDSISNGNSNVNIPSANGNVNISAVGNANIVVVTGTGANINGTLNVTGESNLGNVGNVKITGGTNGYVLQTDGSGNLTWVVPSASVSSISNGNSNVNIPSADGNINLTAVGNTTVVVTGTGVNVSGTLNTTNTATVGNLIAGNANVTGNVALTGANVSLGAVGNLKITGGTGGYVLATDGAGNLSWVTQAAGSSQISNGNSTVSIPGANGNINFTAGGNTNMVITGTGANITGNLETSGPNINLGNISNLHISGGSGGYVIQTDGAGNLSWVAQGGGGGGGSSISNGNSNVIVTFDGNVSTSVNNIANVFVVTDAGANVTGSLSATGNVSFTGPNVNLGDVSNLSIAGGSNGFVLRTDGSGDLSWVAQPANPGTAAAIQEFNASAAQTTFTVLGGYNVGSVIVFVNGIQMNDADYTAANGSTVVLTEPRVAGDTVRILSSMISPAVNVNYLQNFSVAMSIALGI
jgi:hypothetical protein